MEIIVHKHPVCCLLFEKDSALHKLNIRQGVWVIAVLRKQIDEVRTVTTKQTTESEKWVKWELYSFRFFNWSEIIFVGVIR